VLAIRLCRSPDSTFVDLQDVVPRKDRLNNSTYDNNPCVSQVYRGGHPPEVDSIAGSSLLKPRDCIVPVILHAGSKFIS